MTTNDSARLDDLIGRAERLADASGLSLSTVSRKLFNDGKGLARLKAGGQCTVKTLAAATERLDALEREMAPARAQAPKRTETMSASIDSGASRAATDPLTMTHLDRLEAEAIHIMREVAAEAANPVMLYSVGKDSSVMLHLALKAFYPSKPPFPLLHVDTTWKFREMIEFRDRIARERGLKMLVHINDEGVRMGVGPFTHGSALHTDIMKTQALKQALDAGKFDVAFGGARRDEEKSRAKERVLSFRAEGHRWDPKNQRPELWSIYNARISKGQTIRAFPLSNWTELDIWQYIHREKIEIPSLYFAAPRPVVERDGVLIMVDDERMPLGANEKPLKEMVRFRTLGCYPLTGGVRSTATTLPEIIKETLLTKTSERQGRVIDHDQAASMEKKKQEGYF
ncbi:MAG: sulfate adenylyltransferase subunit CysD [Alphaproteobacteria bacterium]|nr:sulfate adenylyltransferase subunit CysD [Alphaproteobacteria bacterium]